MSVIIRDFHRTLMNINLQLIFHGLGRLQYQIEFHLQPCQGIILNSLVRGHSQASDLLYYIQEIVLSNGKADSKSDKGKRVLKLFRQISLLVCEI